MELEKEKYGRNACSAKAEEEMQMQENCAQKKEEVDEVRTVVRDRTDEARSLEEIINVLCDRITTRKSCKLSSLSFLWFLVAPIEKGFL